MRDSAVWHDACYAWPMGRLKRLFTIRTRLEVFLLTFGLAVGATKRGEEYLVLYPGTMGHVLYACCLGAVFLAGAKMLEAVELNNRFPPGTYYD